MGWILSIAGVLGVGGLGAAAWLLGPSVLFRSALGLLTKIPWQVYAIGALAALIAFLFISRAHALDRVHNDEAQLTTICQATRDAAARPRLTCAQVPLQIKFLGKAVTDLKVAIGHQNDAVAALGAKTVQQQQMAVEAQRKAAHRVAGAQAVAQRLRDSARHSPASGAPCEPSDALKGQWQ